MSTTTGAENVRWQLADLYTSDDAALADLSVADDQAVSLAKEYRGKISSLSSSDLATVMRQVEAIQDTIGRAYTYAYLNWVTATADPARGALLQRVQERATATGQRLLFLDVEWAGMEEDAVRAHLAHEDLHFCAHHLELQWLRRAHILSEPEEKILAEKNITGRSAWNRFFDETLGNARFSFQGEEVSEQVVLNALHHPDRELRKEAALSLTEGLDALSHPLTFVFNTILADKASDDRLRGYDSWLDERNLANEIDQEAVTALIDAVTNRYDLSERFYRLKSRLLGLEGEMMDYDRYAPLPQSGKSYSWEEAKEIVLDAYGAFHPKMAEITRKFFDGRWIDAPAVDGKRGGAFSHGAVPSVHPYILLNYLGQARDVQILAHELGHGIHQYLAREQGIFHANTPLTTAETASVFGEMLVFQRLLNKETDPSARLAMIIRKLDDSMATVFRQISMNRFEERIHHHRRTEGELTPDDLARHWIETQKPMFGDAVTLGDHYRKWWSYIPHFVHTPGYVYAYAFGELLVLALYALFESGQEGFEEEYLRLLKSGGSDWPHVLVDRLGINLKDASFWKKGLLAIEKLIEEAEKAVIQTG